MNLCEWDPKNDRPATAGGRTLYAGCGNEALVSVGKEGKWHLCACCVLLPRFRKLKVHVPLVVDRTGGKRLCK